MARKYQVSFPHFSFSLQFNSNNFFPSLRLVPLSVASQRVASKKNLPSASTFCRNPQFATAIKFKKKISFSLAFSRPPSLPCLLLQWLSSSSIQNRYHTWPLPSLLPSGDPHLTRPIVKPDSGGGGVKGRRTPVINNIFLAWFSSLHQRLPPPLRVYIKRSFACAFIISIVALPLAFAPHTIFTPPYPAHSK